MTSPPHWRTRSRRTLGVRALLGALGTATVLGVAAARAGAQTQPVAPAASAPLAIGAKAPDFSLAAVTRYGPLARAIGPADFLGKTLVIAFFYRARTKG